MIFLIIYLLGVVLAVWSIIDVFNTAEFSAVLKVLLTLALIILSWLGIFIYTYVFKPLYLRKPTDL